MNDELNKVQKIKQNLAGKDLNSVSVPPLDIQNSRPISKNIPKLLNT